MKRGKFCYRVVLPNSEVKLWATHISNPPTVSGKMMRVGEWTEHSNNKIQRIKY